jgi:hypothetical protein
MRSHAVINDKSLSCFFNDAKPADDFITKLLRVGVLSRTPTPDEISRLKAYTIAALAREPGGGQVGDVRSATIREISAAAWMTAAVRSTAARRGEWGTGVRSTAARRGKKPTGVASVAAHRGKMPTGVASVAAHRGKKPTGVASIAAHRGEKPVVGLSQSQVRSDCLREKSCAPRRAVFAWVHA